jgi:hypothetical protein
MARGSPAESGRSAVSGRGGGARELALKVGVPNWGIGSGGAQRGGLGVVAGWRRGGGHRRWQAEEEVEGTSSWVGGVCGVGGKLGEVATDAAHSGCGPSAVRCLMVEEGGDVGCLEASRRRRGG